MQIKYQKLFMDFDSITLRLLSLGDTKFSFFFFRTI